MEWPARLPVGGREWAHWWRSALSARETSDAIEAAHREFPELSGVTGVRLYCAFGSRAAVAQAPDAEIARRVHLLGPKKVAWIRARLGQSAVASPDPVPPAPCPWCGGTGVKASD